jgi:hypothetical protein
VRNERAELWRAGFFFVLILLLGVLAYIATQSFWQ